MQKFNVKLTPLVFFGNDANDVFVGGGGTDLLIAGAGDDASNDARYEVERQVA